MKSKDQQLLEEAYHSILEGDIKSELEQIHNMLLRLQSGDKQMNVKLIIDRVEMLMVESGMD
jgi:hypothetical protein